MRWFPGPSLKVSYYGLNGRENEKSRLGPNNLGGSDLGEAITLVSFIDLVQYSAPEVVEHPLS